MQKTNSFSRPIYAIDKLAESTSKCGQDDENYTIEKLSFYMLFIFRI